jgi:hypothetical protein
MYSLPCIPPHSSSALPLHLNTLSQPFLSPFPLFLSLSCPLPRTSSAFPAPVHSSSAFPFPRLALPRFLSLSPLFLSLSCHPPHSSSAFPVPHPAFPPPLPIPFSILLSSSAVTVPSTHFLSLSWSPTHSYSPLPGPRPRFPTCLVPLPTLLPPFLSPCTLFLSLHGPFPSLFLNLPCPSYSSSTFPNPVPLP